MKLLITGATGFIGTHLVKKCLEEGYEILISLLENEVNPFPSAVKTHVFDGKKIESDINYIKDQKVNGVVHLASLFLTKHNPIDAIRLVNSNILFGTNVLECAYRGKVKWFINTGTFWQNYQNANYSPVNLYAATKQAFEDIAQFYFETNQIKFCTLRLSDTYGPNDNRPKIFNLWEKFAKSGELLNMSPGDQMIDISYIDDVTEAYLILLKKLESDSQEIPNGSVYSVKAEKRYTLKELAKVFEEATNLKVNINWGGLTYRKK